MRTRQTVKTITETKNPPASINSFLLEVTLLHKSNFVLDWDIINSFTNSSLEKIHKMKTKPVDIISIPTIYTEKCNLSVSKNLRFSEFGETPCYNDHVRGDLPLVTRSYAWRNGLRINPEGNSRKSHDLFITSSCLLTFPIVISMVSVPAQKRYITFVRFPTLFISHSVIS